MNPTVYQIGLMCHALGISGHNLNSFRNYFAASPNSPDYNHWRELESAGYAACKGSRAVFGDLVCFSVTDAGEVLARELACSRKPKPLSRSQQNYQDYLECEWFNGSFFDWIKYRSNQRKLENQA